VAIEDLEARCGHVRSEKVDEPDHADVRDLARQAEIGEREIRR